MLIQHTDNRLLTALRQTDARLARVFGDLERDRERKDVALRKKLDTMRAEVLKKHGREQIAMRSRSMVGRRLSKLSIESQFDSLNNEDTKPFDSDDSNSVDTTLLLEAPESERLPISDEPPPETTFESISLSEVSAVATNRRQSLNEVLRFSADAFDFGLLLPTEEKTVSIGLTTKGQMTIEVDVSLIAAPSCSVGLKMRVNGKEMGKIRVSGRETKVEVVAQAPFDGVNCVEFAAAVLITSGNERVLLPIKGKQVQPKLRIGCPGTKDASTSPFFASFEVRRGEKDTVPFSLANDSECALSADYEVRFGQEKLCREALTNEIPSHQSVQLRIPLPKGLVGHHPTLIWLIVRVRNTKLVFAARCTMLP